MIIECDLLIVINQFIQLNWWQVFVLTVLGPSSGRECLSRLPVSVPLSMPVMIIIKISENILTWYIDNILTYNKYKNMIIDVILIISHPLQFRSERSLKTSNIFVCILFCNSFNFYDVLNLMTWPWLENRREEKRIKKRNSKQHCRLNIWGGSEKYWEDKETKLKDKEAKIMD